MSNAIWDSYTLSDPPELTAAKWELKKNRLKTIALENKLQSLDPSFPEWEETAQELFFVQEAGKQLLKALWTIETKNRQDPQL